MAAGIDLSLPRHQWKKIKCEGFNLWVWICTDCMTSQDMHEYPDEPEPPAGACLGRGPHDSFHIALARKIFPSLGLSVPDHLREG